MGEMTKELILVIANYLVWIFNFLIAVKIGRKHQELKRE